MAKAFGDKTHIASSLRCLGITYGFLGEFFASYDNLQEAYQLYNAPPSLPGNLDLQRLCCRCGIDMVNAARLTFEDGDKVVSLVRDIEKQAATVSDDQTHSASLVILWSVLDSLVTSPSMSKLSRIAHRGIGHRSRFWKILDIDRRPCVSWSVPSRWGLVL